jgi:hypothetical protein
MSGGSSWLPSRCRASGAPRFRPRSGAGSRAGRCRRWLGAGIGNLGGFVGPSIMGVTEELTGSGAGGLYLVAVVVLIGFGRAATFRWVEAWRAALAEGTS